MVELAKGDFGYVMRRIDQIAQQTPTTTSQIPSVSPLMSDAMDVFDRNWDATIPVTGGIPNYVQNGGTNSRFARTIFRIVQDPDGVQQLSEELHQYSMRMLNPFDLESVQGPDGDVFSGAVYGGYTSCAYIDIVGMDTKVDMLQRQRAWLRDFAAIIANPEMFKSTIKQAMNLNTQSMSDSAKRELDNQLMIMYNQFKEKAKSLVYTITQTQELLTKQEELLKANKETMEARRKQCVTDLAAAGKMSGEGPG